MMPHQRRTYRMSRAGRKILPERCGDFQGGPFHPLQPVEVRKYLCINKWSVTGTDAWNGSQGELAEVNGQSAGNTIRNESKGVLHGEAGADDVVHDKRLESTGQVTHESQAETDIRRYFAGDGFEVVDGFTHIALQNIKHWKTCQR